MNVHRCYWCNRVAEGGGYGGYDAEGKFRTFCSVDCRETFFRAQKAYYAQQKEEAVDG